jgi:CheY-like chemotaxis protein
MARILLVEDDLNVCQLMQLVLVDGGHQVDASGTVLSGLVLFECHPYDIVVADGRLLDGTGVELADRAREKGIPIPDHHWRCFQPAKELSQPLRVSVKTGPPERAIASRRTSAPSGIEGGDRGLTLNSKEYACEAALPRPPL